MFFFTLDHMQIPKCMISMQITEIHKSKQHQQPPWRADDKPLPGIPPSVLKPGEQLDALAQLHTVPFWAIVVQSTTIAPLLEPNNNLKLVLFPQSQS